MNLEIPIKHIITDQRRAGGAGRASYSHAGRLAVQGCLVCPGSWGLGGGLEWSWRPHLFLGKSRATCGVVAHLGVMFTSLAHRAGDSTWLRPPCWA